MQDGLRSIEVDMVEVIVPGQYVRTLTCASQLIERLPFSKIAYDKRKVQSKHEELSRKPDHMLTEAQRTKMEAEQTKKLA